MSRAGQLHSSLNGGSLEQGGIDKLTAPAPLLDVDMPLDAVPLLDVDTLLSAAERRSHFLDAENASRWGNRGCGLHGRTAQLLYTRRTKSSG